jgi:hypothetical protein
MTHHNGDVEKLSSAFGSWLVALRAWLDADRRLADARQMGKPPAHLTQAVRLLKIQADALYEVARKELHMVNARAHRPIHRNRSGGTDPGILHLIQYSDLSPGR